MNLTKIEDHLRQGSELIIEYREYYGNVRRDEIVVRLYPPRSRRGVTHTSHGSTILHALRELEDYVICPLLRYTEESSESN